MARKTVLHTVKSYRTAMREFSRMPNLAVWYSRVDAPSIVARWGERVTAEDRKRFERTVAKGEGKNSLKAVEKLTRVEDGRPRFVSDPPTLVPLDELAASADASAVVSSSSEWLRERLSSYAASLQYDRRLLVESYELVDFARKVVGVGSVGTRCWIVLMRGRDDDDPLFLQIKEAQSSVLAGHLSAYGPRNEGARVVAGQRVMQAASDIFLGWQRAVGLDGQSRDFYVRQLHDWKGSVTIERMVPKGMRLYGQLCAWTLARAHARSGDRIAIAAYLGDDDHVAQAVADFAEAYADLNERDHAAFVDAVASGRLGVAREAMA